MHRHRATALIVLGVAATLTSNCRPPAPSAKPSLVVVITVDGLGRDLLTRNEAFLSGGLRRLMVEGRYFAEASVDHGITVSHPGHVTIATGFHPANHGIVDAAFAVPEAGRLTMVDAVADPMAPILGHPALDGASPHRIAAPTLAEWIQSTDPTARMVAIGGGRHSSLLHAGHAHGDVYWFDRDVGRFVTSAAYAERPASWVEAFNDQRLPGLIDGAREWRSSIPPQAARKLGPDARSFEADGEHTTLPHLFSAEMTSQDPSAAARWFTWGPFLDGAVLELVRLGVTDRDLGRRGVLDIVDIVLSQTDSITHYYGPDSHEMADGLFRLDRELGGFFEFLDDSVGVGRWVCALSSDHGMARIPEHRLALGLPAHRIQPEEIEAILDPLRQLDEPSSIAERLRNEEVVAAVYTPEQLAGIGSQDPFLELYRHSWRPDRVARIPLFSLTHLDAPIAESGLLVRLTEGTMIALDVVIHGSPYAYDRKVPLLFLGPGVTPGVATEPARTVDVAPTLAGLAGIPIPSGLDGRVLSVR
jgi:hypothetical protein